eukprot:2413170-Prymnesium_polylepis.1
MAWLLEEGCPMAVGDCARAAYAGELRALQWLRSHGCPWDASSCGEAVAGGQLAVLKWAHGNGCPLHDDNWTITFCSAFD